MQPFHFEHAPIRYIICIIPPRVPPHFRPNTSGSSFKIQKMELSMATDLPLWTSDDCIKFVQQSMKNLDQKYQTMIWIELSAIWDPIMWLDPLWWNFQMKNGGSSFLWWDCEYISVRHLKKWLRLKKRLHFRSCIDEGFPNHQRSKQRNWLCIRESHLFSAKAMFSLYQMTQSSMMLIQVFPLKMVSCWTNGIGVQAVPCDNRPFPPAVDLWWALEIRLTEWIKEMHGLRKPVIRILVIKKALEFEPNFMGRPLAPQFMKQALSWYYRFISRRQNHLSIQKSTSVVGKRTGGY